MTELTKLWEIIENLATKVAKDDKIEHQLIKVGLTIQLNLHLALAISMFRGTGEYDAQIHEFKAKPIADKTFANFRSLIVKKYAK